MPKQKGLVVSLNVGNKHCPSLPLELAARVREALTRATAPHGPHPVLSPLGGDSIPQAKCPVLVVRMEPGELGSIFTAYLVEPDGRYLQGWRECGDDIGQSAATWLTELSTADQGLVQGQLRVLAGEHRLKAKKNRRAFRNRKAA